MHSLQLCSQEARTEPPVLLEPASHGSVKRSQVTGGTGSGKSHTLAPNCPAWVLSVHQAFSRCVMAPVGLFRGRCQVGDKQTIKRQRLDLQRGGDEATLTLPPISSFCPRKRETDRNIREYLHSKGVDLKKGSVRLGCILQVQVDAQAADWLCGYIPVLYIW